MKNMIILLFTFLSVCRASSQELPKDIQNEICNCDSESVFTTIIRAKQLRIYFPEKVFSNFYDKENHNIKINSQIKKSAFIDSVSRYYFIADNKSKILKVLNEWCSENKFLDKLGDINDENPPEAILFHTKKTRFLFNKFLKLPTQSWLSLSTYQLYELDIDFLNYFESLSIEGRKKLNRRLQITANELNSKN